MSAIQRTIIGLTLIAALAVQDFGAQTASNVPSDAEIRRILAERVDRYRQSVGIVVGVIEPSGRRVVSYGSLKAGDTQPLNGNTVFEIGSITKVFTSLLLADMVERREVALSDPVAQYLPAEVRMPEWRGQKITLQDLATHTSGLPRMPTNVNATDPSNPFADYSIQQFYEFLSGYQLSRSIASRFEYSNLGGALLGHALAQRAESNFAELVEARITAPLAMNSTRVSLTPAMQSRFATGHAYGLEPTASWDLGAFTAAGGLHSTVNDLLTFLAAHLGYTQTTLAPAMASMLKVRRNSGRGEVALAWFVESYGGMEIISHEGSTGGFQSFIGYDPKTRIGVVVLSNNGTGAGMEDIGLHLLNPRVPLLDGRVLEPPKQRTEVAADPMLLDRYTGHYRFPSGQMATVTHEDNHLFLQADGDVKLAFYPENSQEFFARIMDAQITFIADPQGRITELIFVRNGSNYHVKHID